MSWAEDEGIEPLIQDMGGMFSISVLINILIMSRSQDQKLNQMNE